jgi:Ca2+-transporting ATPase
MITGDHARTAAAIAEQSGIDGVRVLSGADMDVMAKVDLTDVNVFARVTSQQKLKLIEAFKAAGHVVAMTGDGVNGAPALKAAHIGIVMGQRGTDVAREAA